MVGEMKQTTIDIIVHVVIVIALGLGIHKACNGGEMTSDGITYSS